MLVALYILGLLVILVSIVFSKRRMAWFCGLLAYTAGPVALIMLAVIIGDVRQDLRTKRALRGEEENRVAFAAFCADRQRMVDWRVPNAGNAALRVRIKEDFPGRHADFSPHSLQANLRLHANACEKGSLGFLESVHDIADKAGSLIGRQVYTYPACTAQAATVTQEPGARFEIIIGEAVENEAAPWPGLFNSRMASSSVRVVDTQTGTTLARDTLYLLLPHGGGTCPNPDQQIPALIADVFPKS